MAIARVNVPSKSHFRHKLSHYSGNIKGVGVVSGVYVVACGGLSRVGFGEVQHERQQRHAATKRDSFHGFEVGRAVGSASNESLMTEHFELFNDGIAGPAEVFSQPAD